MDNQSAKNKLIEKISAANNILLAVSHSPSTDELTAALALSLALNKLGKRSVAVFSGQVPKSLAFLSPERTFQTSADSLRDFIISIDKDKADRLRCKVEGDFVRVYITPYQNTLNKDDLQFSTGDFNVELVIAIGVSKKEELDNAIASHGKIFHSATISTLNLNKIDDTLGSISWYGDNLTCYAEMVNDLIRTLDNGKGLIDQPVATALMSGVVAATNQFKNSSTTPAIMTLAANLMASGANQQFIIEQLSIDSPAESSVAAKEDISQKVESLEKEQVNNNLSAGYDVSSSAKPETDANNADSSKDQKGQEQALLDVDLHEVTPSDTINQNEPKVETEAKSETKPEIKPAVSASIKSDHKTPYVGDNITSHPLSAASENSSHQEVAKSIDNNSQDNVDQPEDSAPVAAFQVANKVSPLVPKQELTPSLAESSSPEPSPSALPPLPLPNSQSSQSLQLSESLPSPAPLPNSSPKPPAEPLPPIAPLPPIPPAPDNSPSLSKALPPLPPLPPIPPADLSGNLPAASNNDSPMPNSAPASEPTSNPDVNRNPDTAPNPDPSQFVIPS